MRPRYRLVKSMRKTKPNHWAVWLLNEDGQEINCVYWTPMIF